MTDTELKAVYSPRYGARRMELTQALHIARMIDELERQLWSIPLETTREELLTLNGPKVERMYEGQIVLVAEREHARRLCRIEYQDKTLAVLIPSDRRVEELLRGRAKFQSWQDAYLKMGRMYVRGHFRCN